MSSDDILNVFVKYPESGSVKTRLAEAIGKEEAASLYRLFVETIITRTRDDRFKRIIYYTPADKKEEMIEWLGFGGAGEFYPQKGNDLGERLYSSFKQSFEAGAKRVIVIGTDSPLLDKNIIGQAFEQLECGKGAGNNQCVIGPSSDGGYYLLGLSCFYQDCQKIFKDIDWGTDRVLGQTLDILKKSGIKFDLLDENFDIDKIEDLIRLKDILQKERKISRPGLRPFVEAVERVLTISPDQRE